MPIKYQTNLVCTVGPTFRRTSHDTTQHRLHTDSQDGHVCSTAEPPRTYGTEMLQAVSVQTLFPVKHARCKCVACNCEFQRIQNRLQELWVRTELDAKFECRSQPCQVIIRLANFIGVTSLEVDSTTQSTRQSVECWTLRHIRECRPCAVPHRIVCSRWQQNGPADRLPGNWRFTRHSMFRPRSSSTSTALYSGGVSTVISSNSDA